MTRDGLIIPGEHDYDCVVLDDRRCFPLSTTTPSVSASSFQHSDLHRQQYWYQGVMELPGSSVRGECDGYVGMGRLMAFLSLCEGALYASVLSSSPSSSLLSGMMQMQMLPCSLVAGLGDGQGGPYVVAISIAARGIIAVAPDKVKVGDSSDELDSSSGVWLVTHAHSRKRKCFRRGNSKGNDRGVDNSNNVVFLPIRPAAAFATNCRDVDDNRIEGSSEMSTREGLFAAGGWMRRVLELPDTDTVPSPSSTPPHISGSNISNSSGSGVGGRDNRCQMSLALAMQEVMLRMQTLASQQEGIHFPLAAVN